MNAERFLEFAYTEIPGATIWHDKYPEFPIFTQI